MKGKKHPDRVRAKVIAALLAGDTVTEAAERCGVDKSVVSRWKRHFTDDELHRLATANRSRIEEMTLSYLGGLLTALKAQCEVAAEPAYIRKQSASDLVELHECLAGRAGQLLAAIGGGSRNAQLPG